MDGTDQSQGLAVSRERERGLRDEARDWLRVALRGNGGGAFDRLGEGAILRSADAMARLARFEQRPAADGVLAEIRALAETLFAPPAPRSWWSRPRDPQLPVASVDRFAPLIDRLDAERDDAARRRIVARTDRARLVEGDAALETAIHLIRAVAAAVESAARELQGDAPDRAARLREEAAVALLERERAVLMQLAVHRQAGMTIDLMLANLA